MNPSQLSLFDAPAPRHAAPPALPAELGVPKAFMQFVGDERSLLWRHVMVYQRVKFGQRWMIAMAKRGPLVAVVTSPVSGAPPEDHDGEAWFSADLYELGGELVRRNMLVPNAAVFITEGGYRAAIDRGADAGSMPAILSCLAEQASEENEAPSSPVAGESIPSVPAHVAGPEPAPQASAPEPPPAAPSPARPIGSPTVRLTRPEPSQGRAPCNSRRWTELVPWPDLSAQRFEHLAPWQRDPAVGSAFRMPGLPGTKSEVVAVTLNIVHAWVDGPMGIDPGAERRWVLCDVFVLGGSASRWPVVIDGQQTALHVDVPGRVDQVLVPCALLTEPVGVELQ